MLSHNNSLYERKLYMSKIRGIYIGSINYELIKERVPESKGFLGRKLLYSD